MSRASACRRARAGIGIISFPPARIPRPSRLPSSIVRIGPHFIANNLAVAPMAGVTDRPFRQLCKRLGAGYAVSEMVASNPRLWGTEKSQRRIDHARRGRADRRADRRRRSGDDGRRRALQRRPRRADHRHQHGLPGEEGLQRRPPARRCCATSRWWPRSSTPSCARSTCRSRSRSAPARDPAQPQRAAHRAHRRGRGHPRAGGARPHARLRASPAPSSTTRSARSRRRWRSR